MELQIKCYVNLFPSSLTVGSVSSARLLSPRGPLDTAGDTDGWSPPGPLLKLLIVHRMGEIVDASVRADS